MVTDKRDWMATPNDPVQVARPCALIHDRIGGFTEALCDPSSGTRIRVGTVLIFPL
jgi:hypothetical protein